MSAETYLVSGANPGYQVSSSFQGEFSNAFTVTAAGFINTLRWYRNATTGAGKPVRLHLWNLTDHLLLADVASPPDTGAVGWQEVRLGVTVPVVTGKTYAIAGQWANLAGYPIYILGTLPTPGSGLAWASPYTRYTANGTYGEPGAQTTASLIMGLDAGYSVTSDPAPGGATSGDVNNALAAWLSTTDGTQTDSAPLQDHTTLSTVNTNTAAVKADADDWAFGLGAAAHGYYADVKTLIGNIKTVTDTLPTPIAQLTSIVLDHYAADIAGILAQIDSVLSSLGAQSTDLSGTAGSAVGALSGRTGFPATGWSMSAEEDFEDAIAFAEPADAYVLTITSYQDTQPANASPAGLWLPRLGWWCVLNGTLAAQRQFVDFQEMLLSDAGRRMPGCAIQLRPGTLATVQAWVLA